MRATIEREGMILLAGRAAEQIAGGVCRGGRDRLDALALVGFLSGSPAEERAYVRWLHERAHTLLLVHWRAVTAVAEALLDEGYLDGETIRRLARRADRSLARS